MKTIPCPTCKTPVEWSEKSLYRPFCSERCRQIDLGAWSDESYSIPCETEEQWSESDLDKEVTFQ